MLTSRSARDLALPDVAVRGARAAQVAADHIRHGAGLEAGTIIVDRIDDRDLP